MHRPACRHAGARGVHNPAYRRTLPFGRSTGLWSHILPRLHVDGQGGREGDELGVPGVPVEVLYQPAQQRNVHGAASG